MSKTEKPRRAVFVYGPAMTGKTFHKLAIAEALGCLDPETGAPLICDDYLHSNKQTPTPGALHLCYSINEVLLSDEKTRAPSDALVLPVAAALAIAYMKGLI